MMASETAQSAAEHTALIVRAPELGTVAIGGVDRQSWLNGLVTSDVAKLKPGGASYGLALVKVGRIVSDIWVLHAGDKLLVAVQGDRAALFEDHLEKYLLMEDATHENVSGEFAWAFAHGPRAANVAEKAALLPGVFAGIVELRGPADGVIVAPRDRLDAVLAALAVDIPGVVVGSVEDGESLRVRRFLPRFGVDFGEKNYPQEAALEKIAVSFNKGCYLGQEVVCRLEMRGHVTKKIVPVRFEGQAPAQGVEVHGRDGKLLGKVSSAVTDDGGAVGLAMVHIDFANPGTKLSVDGREATVLGA